MAPGEALAMPKAIALLTVFLTVFLVEHAHAQVAHPTTPSGPEAVVVDLAARLEVTFGLAPAVARLHAEAAVMAELDGITAEVLVAVAAKESSFNHRLHGRLKTARGVSRFCGVLQAMSGGSARRCRELAEIEEGYAAGAREIAYWLDGRCKGSLDCALACHGCGNSGLTGGCAAYPRAIWARLARMRAGTKYAPRRR